ncbi:MAG TPA: hypothetical protein VGV38_19860, partial [Pyrinomonadaceae bacterium]|nr:hypothetical protein [Pyrinomonadaceae bacterium]
QLRAALDSARSRETTARLNAFGALRAFEFVEHDTRANPSSPDRGARYRATFERGHVLLRFVVNGEGKLSVMSVEEEE